MHVTLGRWGEAMRTWRGEDTPSASGGNEGGHVGSGTDTHTHTNAHTRMGLGWLLDRVAEGWARMRSAFGDGSWFRVRETLQPVRPRSSARRRGSLSIAIYLSCASLYVLLAIARSGTLCRMPVDGSAVCTCFACPLFVRAFVSFVPPHCAIASKIRIGPRDTRQRRIDRARLTSRRCGSPGCQLRCRGSGTTLSTGARSRGLWHGGVQPQFSTPAYGHNSSAEVGSNTSWKARCQCSNTIWNARCEPATRPRLANRQG